MTIKVLIVEDQFIEANNLKHILIKARYGVCTIARSVPEALRVLDEEQP
jgi:two-component system response regulator HydG